MEHSGPPGQRRGPQSRPDPEWPDDGGEPLEEERWPSRRGMRPVPPPSPVSKRDEGFENGWFGKPTGGGGSSGTRGANGRRPGSVNGQANGRVNGAIGDRLNGSGKPPAGQPDRGSRPPSGRDDLFRPADSNGLPPDRAGSDGRPDRAGSTGRNGLPPDRTGRDGTRGSRNGDAPAGRTGRPPSARDDLSAAPGRGDVPPMGPSSRNDLPPAGRNGRPPAAGSASRNDLPPAGRNGRPPAAGSTSRNDLPPAGRNGRPPGAAGSTGSGSRNDLPPAGRNGRPPAAGSTSRNDLPPAGRNGRPPGAGGSTGSDSRNDLPPVGMNGRPPGAAGLTGSGDLPPANRTGRPPAAGPTSSGGLSRADLNGRPPGRGANDLPPAGRNGLPPGGTGRDLPPVGPGSRNNLPPAARNGLPAGRNNVPPGRSSDVPTGRMSMPPAARDVPPGGGPEWPGGPVSRTNLPPAGAGRNDPPTSRINMPPTGAGRTEPPTMAIPVPRVDPPTMANRLAPDVEPEPDDTPTDPGPFSRIAFESHPPVPPPTRRRHSVDGPIEGDPKDVRHEEPDADEHDTPKKKTKRKLPFWIELPLLIVVALLLTFTIQTFVARVYVIPSGSMELTLNGNNGTGDRILVDKVVYDFHPPRPGDVVVFKGPPGWDQTEFFVNNETNPVLRWLHDLASSIGVAKPDEYDLVKRVIAVGGQTISCCDKDNRIVVDGKSLTEPYVYWQPDRGGPAQQQRFGPVKIPQGYLWVMGDNRNNSDDSRFQNGGGIHGVVPVGNVIGKARTIIWPPSRWRGIGDFNAQQAAGVADGAPSWLGVPATGVGVLASLPTLWFGRRFGKRLRAAAGIAKQRR